MALEHIFKFADLLDTFQSIERVVRVRNKDEWENDVEHSYQLAMLGWYLIDSLKLPLDINKVLRYALVHDLPEVYAGDSYAYGDARKDKDAREAQSVTRLTKEFGDTADIIIALESYRAQADEESKFVYALDKLIPMISCYLDNGRTWKEKNISLDMIVSYKKDKVAVSPVVAELFSELVVRLQQQEKELFTQAE